MYIHTYMYTRIYIFIYMCVHIYKYIYTSICIFAYIYPYMYIYINIWFCMQMETEDLHYHKRAYSPMGAYAASKLANILFTKVCRVWEYTYGMCILHAVECTRHFDTLHTPVGAQGVSICMRYDAIEFGWEYTYDIIWTWIHTTFWHLTHTCAQSRLPTSSSTPTCIGRQNFRFYFMQWNTWDILTPYTHLHTHTHPHPHTDTQSRSPMSLSTPTWCPCLYTPALSPRTWVATFSTKMAGWPGATHCSILQHTATRCITLQHTATHCNTLQHTATHCNTLQRTATHCSALQRNATHCNTLQRTTTHILNKDSQVEIVDVICHLDTQFT